MNWQNYYRPPSADLWQGRVDGLSGERFFQVVQCIDLRTVSVKGMGEYAIIGFCCDEGIRRNLGRLGAVEGPQALRDALGRLAVHANKEIRLLDVGNIHCKDDNLEAAQESLALVIHQLLQAGIKPIAIGGGHEIAWGHYQGIRLAYPKVKLGIINFDAHFDLRPLLHNNRGSSGTPFLQMAQSCQQQQLDFSYLCLGIQQAANTRSLFNTAKQWGVQWIAAELIHQKKLDLENVQRFIDAQDAIYLSLCLDVFATAFAPGVSAPQPLGLYPAQVSELLKYIVDSGKVLSFDIAELSPLLDRNSQTAQLAASLVTEFVNACSRLQTG